MESKNNNIIMLVNYYGDWFHVATLSFYLQIFFDDFRMHALIDVLVLLDYIARIIFGACYIITLCIIIS